MWKDSKSNEIKSTLTYAVDIADLAAKIIRDEKISNPRIGKPSNQKLLKYFFFGGGWLWSGS